MKAPRPAGSHCPPSHQRGAQSRRLVAGRIVSWGGQVRYDPGLPHLPNRLDAVARGEIDAIFDEAIIRYGNGASELGMRFLPVGEVTLQRLEAIGFRRGAIEKSLFSKLPEDVLTVDFSGFPAFTSASVPDESITAICAALEARKERIPWEGGDGPLPLDRMCRDTLQGPMDVPLHRAAERFWRERGYLS